MCAKIEKEKQTQNRFSTECDLSSFYFRRRFKCVWDWADNELNVCLCVPLCSYRMQCVTTVKWNAIISIVNIVDGVIKVVFGSSEIIAGQISTMSHTYERLPIANTMNSWLLNVECWWVLLRPNAVLNRREMEKTKNIRFHQWLIVLYNFNCVETIIVCLRRPPLAELKWYSSSFSILPLAVASTRKRSKINYKCNYTYWLQHDFSLMNDAIDETENFHHRPCTIH